MEGLIILSLILNEIGLMLGFFVVAMMIRVFDPKKQEFILSKIFAVIAIVFSVVLILDSLSRFGRSFLR